MSRNDRYREILEELVQSARAMGPYRDDVVIAGGLVPLLYRFHPDYDRPRPSPLLTGDLDWTAPETLPMRGDTRLRAHLEKHGFTIVPSRRTRGDVPPKHVFQAKERGTNRPAEIHGEFLVPLIGSKTDRHGNPKSPREIQEGLTAEAIRYLDLLLWRPVDFDIRHLEEVIEVDEDMTIQIPRLGPYLVQKALCSERRDRTEKRNKDLAYIFDVVMLAHPDWGSMREEIDDLETESSEWSSWIEDALSILRDAFEGDAPPGPQRVESIYEDESSVRASTVERVMGRFVREWKGE